MATQTVKAAEAAVPAVARAIQPSKPLFKRKFGKKQIFL
jgi:hypothetical protein